MSKKTFLIARLVLLFIIIIYIIFLPVTGKSTDSLVNQKQDQVSLQTTPSPTANQNTIPAYTQYPPVSDATLPSTPGNWVTGDNPAYTIKFPPDLKPNITRVLGGGTHVVLKSEAQQYFPRFDLEAAPSDPDSPIEKRIEQLKGLTPLNYSEDMIKFRGYPAIQVSEILPISDLQGNPVDKTYIFFSKQNITYVATMAYFRDANADYNRQMLLQILNSLTLK